jgi:DNA mismatch repair protein MSH6
MAKDSTVRAAHSPATPTTTLKKSTSNTQNMKNQKTLLGFFQKTPNTASSTSTLPDRPSPASRKKAGLQGRSFVRANGSQITPVPSSDALDEDDNTAQQNISKESSRSTEGLPSPVSSANGELGGQTMADAEELTNCGTPSRKVSQPRFLYLQNKLICN